MAIRSFVQSCGPILILVLLQTTNIIALQCYGCWMGPDAMPELNPKKGCLLDTPPDELLISNYSSIPFLQANVEDMRQGLSRLLTMTKGPFCVKMWMWYEANDERSVVRYISPEAPTASSLDSDGCHTGDKVRMCFCDRDKCNGDGPEQDGKAKSNSKESTTTASSSEIQLISPAQLLLMFMLTMLAGKCL